MSPNRDLRAGGDRPEKAGIAGDEGRLRRDREHEPGHFARGFEHATRHLKRRLCGLVGIGGGPERHDLSTPLRLLELCDEVLTVDLLHIDLSLERLGIAQTEKLVRAKQYRQAISQPR
jgi:hypothetical protein